MDKFDATGWLMTWYRAKWGVAVPNMVEDIDVVAAVDDARDVGYRAGLLRAAHIASAWDIDAARRIEAEAGKQK